MEIHPFISTSDLSNEVISFFLSEAYQAFDTLLGTVSTIVVIFGAGSLYLAAKTYRKNREDREQDVTYQKKKNTNELIGKFLKEIRPKIIEFEYAYQKQKTILKERITEEEILEELLFNTKLKLGVDDIFAQLHDFSNYVQSELVYEKLLINSIAILFCSFVEENKEFIKENKRIDHGVVYELYNKWQES